MKDKIVPFLVALVVIGAFVIGHMYGKLSVYEGGPTAKKTDEAAAADQGIPVAPPAEERLAANVWEEIQVDPAGANGDPKAGVVIVEFSDYECPFCSRYYEDAYMKMVDTYIDAGEVYYMFRDLPLGFHQNAKTSALAARCAGEQDKYFDMHDKLYENQQEWTTGEVKAAFVKYAGEIGLNVSQFTTCYDSAALNEAIEADAALAARIGATGTPTFYINGEKLVGAQPWEAFESAIEAALEE